MDILLVEDDDQVRAVVASSLREAGFSVIEADRIETALEALTSRTPELVLLGLGMPNGTMRGVELLAQLHEHAEWAGIPVVVLSGLADLLNREVLTRLGVRTVLQKPLLGTAVVSAVREALAS